jgi:hypothetical protein
MWLTNLMKMIKFLMEFRKIVFILGSEKSLDIGG